MFINKYLIRFETMERFQQCQSEVAVNYLLKKKWAIISPYVTYLGQEIDWEVEAKSEAKNIWNEQDLANKNLEKIDLAQLALQYTGDRFAYGTDGTDTALDCLRELSNFDTDERTARTRTYWAFLQDRACETFARAVLNELMNMIENQ